ncbi:oxidoreductase [Bremerella alba]|uniref:3-phenylpropionate-dihydrodiol/cinnamic acid-dihydrodiol dehydrogenase n=1 Tax=Bremerella alba TaxID=980252 RepID=A0A7V9AA66_9BACT|nr:oxidoreductase [Bremerella alba]MBA2117861.1 3-phenylpropionate-dihydrodiol/cinnamic acid-dihydrodiol dehydrogenase [Bremerella alba]
MKTWFITGASRGFGALIAKQALASGDNVVATARNPQGVVEAVGSHSQLLAVALDLADEMQAHAAVAAAVERFGGIDILLNNAGFGLLGAVEEATAEEVEHLYRTNVFGLLNVTRAVLPQMRRQRSGHVLNISSSGGYRAGAGFGVYCSTKFAVEGLSEALAEELSPLGIRVTIVEPGYFRTDFLEAKSLLVSPTRIEDYNATAGTTRQRAEQVSRHQPGDPKKFAVAMVQLAGSQDAPLRMPFGSDAVAAIEAKNAFVTAELTKWQSLSVGTDF